MAEAKKCRIVIFENRQYKAGSNRPLYENGEISFLGKDRKVKVPALL